MFSRSCFLISKAVSSYETLFTRRSYSALGEPTKGHHLSKGSKRRRGATKSQFSLDSKAIAGFGISSTTQSNAAHEQFKLGSNWSKWLTEKEEHRTDQFITCIHLLPLDLNSNTLRELFWECNIRVLEAWKPIGKRSGMIQTTFEDQKTVLNQLNKKRMPWGVLEAQPAGLATTMIELSTSEESEFNLVSGKSSVKPKRNKDRPFIKPDSFFTMPSSSISSLPTLASTSIKNISTGSPTTVSEHSKDSNYKTKSLTRAETKLAKAQANFKTNVVTNQDDSLKPRVLAPAEVPSQQKKADVVPSPQPQRGSFKAASAITASNTPQFGTTPQRQIQRQGKKSQFGLISRANHVETVRQTKSPIDGFVPRVKTPVKEKAIEENRTEKSRMMTGWNMPSSSPSLSLSVDEMEKSKAPSTKKSRAAKKLLKNVFRTDGKSEKIDRTNAASV